MLHQKDELGYTCVCEAHNVVSRWKNKMQVKEAAGCPWEWCIKCRELMDNKKKTSEGF